MLNRDQFYHLLNLINIEVTPALETGQLEAINITRETLSCEVVFCFENVLDIEIARLFINRTKDYFIKAYKVNEVNVRINYQNGKISNELLNTYFETIVKECAKDKPRYSALSNFNYKCDNQEIVIYVANEQEIALINELISGIKPIFNYFSLDIMMKVEVSPFETPIAQLIEKNQEQLTVELLRDQMSYENTASKDEVEDKPKKQKVIRAPRVKEGLNRPTTPLNKIPASEVELIEYKQRVGNNEFTIIGDIVESRVEERQSKNDPKSRFLIYSAILTDGNDSIMIKTFINQQFNENFYRNEAVAGKKAKVYGYVEYDKFVRDIVLAIDQMIIVGDAEEDEIIDDAPVKRVELHAHTKMSTQDSVMDVEEYVRQAVKFKHRALAVTDMYNIHVLPDFEKATKNLDILPIYGVEGALVDEEKDCFK